MYPIKFFELVLLVIIIFVVIASKAFAFEEWHSSDDPFKLVQSTLLTNILEAEQRGLNQGQVQTQPWSDHYWPTLNGGIAWRYQSHNGNVNTLSPAEKYSLLIGDHTNLLSKTLISRSKEQGIENWMGICDGWAAASLMLPKPQRPVQLIAADGVTPITFYPADIQALASHAWSFDNYYKKRFIGNRCQEVKLARDQNHRIIKQECRDSNPGTFHLALLNQVGIKKKSFIMDISKDHEVWNHPVVSYRVKFFNPETLIESSSLRSSVLARNKVSSDIFSRHRSSKAAYIVGVSVSVEFSTINTPIASSGPTQNQTKTMNFIYDLELDSNYNIVGGEWQDGTIPDFLWLPEENAKLIAFGDHLIQSNWDISKPLPQDWQQGALSGLQYGIVLGHIVNKIFQAAQ